MIAIRTKNLSRLFSDFLGFGKFLRSLKAPIGLVVSPGDGKDWELSGSIPEDRVKVYSLIPHIKNSKETVDSEKLALGVLSIVPLFPASLIGEEEDLGGYLECGIYDVQDTEEIIKFKEVSGRYPDVVRLSINPLKYPKEILDYCKESGIEVIGTDIFGPQILREYYRNLFPESFLQAFGEHSVDVLEIPGDDPYFIKRVFSRKGGGQENPKLLEYAKDIDRVPNLKSPKSKIYQTVSMKIPGVGEISLPSPKGKFTLKPSPEVLNLGEPLWEDDLIPEDVDMEDKELLGTLHRYHVLPKISELHPTKVWKPVFTKILPDFWAIKMIPKGWLGWFWKEHIYWMISGKLWKIPLSAHESLMDV